MDQLVSDIGEIIQTTGGMVLVGLGLLAGLLIAWLLSAAKGKGAASGSTAELNELQNEFDGYKDQVNAHFARTSELVGQLTSDYRAVYEHLAQSADTLCSVDASGQPLGFPQMKLVEADAPAETDNTPDESPEDEADTTVAEAEVKPAEVEDATAASAAAEEPKPEADSAQAPVAASIPDSIDSDAAKKPA